MIFARKCIALCALIAGSAQAAPTVNLIADPTAGTAPLTVILTWTSTGAATCAASGGWSGSKALNGSQTLTGISATTNYTLTCTASTGPILLTWTPPTTNVDGSPLTDLAAYVVYRASTEGGLETTSNTFEVLAPASSFTQNAPVGLRWFGIKARNSTGVLSVMSNTVSKNVIGDSADATATITIGTQPNPPTGITVTQTLAMELRISSSGVAWLVREVGTVPLGTSCIEPALLAASGNDWYEVPRSAVTFKVGNVKTTSKIVARCG